VLGGAAKDTGLLEYWHLDREQAALRLRGLLSLNVVPDSVRVEVKLASSPGADAVVVCRSILDHVFAEEAGLGVRKAEKKMAAVQAGVEKAEAEAARAKDRYSAMSAEAAGDPAAFNPGVTLAKAEYFAKEGEAEDWRMIVETMNKELAAASVVEKSYEGPEWRSESSTEGLGSSGPVILGSIAAGGMLALILARILEWLFPSREKAGNALPAPP
jgi:hypothetical protein